MTKSMAAFIKRLVKFLEDFGWTQQVLAEKVGVTNAAVSLYLNGKREPSLEIIDRIAKVLGVPTRVFFEDEDFAMLRYVPDPVDAARIVTDAATELDELKKTGITKWPKAQLKLLGSIEEQSHRDIVMISASHIANVAPKSARALVKPRAVK